VYEETHSVTSNDFGLITAIVGDGSASSGNFSAIAWLTDDYYLEVEVNDGGGYVQMSNTQLMSVPYALAAETAKTAEMASNMSLDDLTDVNAGAASNGDVLTWNGTEWVAQAGGGGGGDNWGSQVVQTDATLSGNGTAGNPLSIPNDAINMDHIQAGAVSSDEIADGSIEGSDLNQMGAIVGDVLKWDGTTWAPDIDNVSGGGGGIGGSGTANYVAKFTGAAAIGNSNIFDNGTNVGIGDASPLATLTVGNGDKLQIAGSDGDITFNDDQGSITFANADAVNAPMIHLFTSGTTNSDRMVFAHSPAFTNWGLQYQDGTDRFNFLSGGTNVMTVDLSQLRVGIGVASPTAKLDVAGTFKLADGTQAAGRVLTSDASGNASWQAPAAGGVGGSGTANYLSKFTSGTDIGNSVVYETAGNIGIGTTTPGAKLEVNGQVKITGGAPGAGKVLTSDASGLATWQTPAAGGVGGSGTANYLPLWTAGTTLGNSVVYQSGSNIGIGDITPAATFTVGNGDKFQVAGTDGDVTFTDDDATITFPIAASGNAPMIHMFSAGAANVDRMVLAHSPAYTNWGLQYQDGTDKFNFLRNGTGVFTVDLNNERVGVGTTSPASMFHVHGPSFGIGIIQLTNNNTGSTAGDGLEILMNDNFLSITNQENGPMDFGTNNVSRMVIAADGNVGIGLSSPTQRLHVHDPGFSYVSFTTPASGTAAFSDGLLVGYQSSGGYVYNYEASPLYFGTSGSAKVRIETNGNVSFGPSGLPAVALSDLHIKQTATPATTGGIRYEEFSGSDYWTVGYGTADDFDWYWNGVLKGYLENTAGTFTNASDRSLKSEIEPLQNMLQVVDQLQPVKYYFNDTRDLATRKAYGFIAQDVEQVLPEIVMEKGELKTLAYTDFGVISIQAIRELHQLVKTQNELLEAQQEQLESLQQRIEALEAE
jgi:hypothetical protein